MVGEINWNNIGVALQFYDRRDYKYVEVPWIVPRKIAQETCPKDRWIVNSDLGCLVGSAEQSFMHINSQIGLGKFIACTPCFRNEDKVDQLHQRTFMKVELYANDRIHENYDLMIKDAMELVRFLAPDHDIGMDTTSEGVDIFLNGVEIGSYGIRSYNGVQWAYGTGIAEPRFSTAKKIVEIS
jgi:hypothetical protein